jgi:hypothetical protein
MIEEFEEEMEDDQDFGKQPSSLIHQEEIYSE